MQETAGRTLQEYSKRKPCGKIHSFGCKCNDRYAIAPTPSLIAERLCVCIRAGIWLESEVAAEKIWLVLTKRQLFVTIYFLRLQIHTVAALSGIHTPFPIERSLAGQGSSRWTFVTVRSRCFPPRSHPYTAINLSQGISSCQINGAFSLNLRCTDIKIRR